MKKRKRVCELCKAKNEKFRLIKQNKHAFATMCIEPLNHGHVMILPKRHVTKLSQLKPSEAKQFLNLSLEMVSVITKLTKKDCILVQNYGQHASQGHLHFHVIPCTLGIREMIAKYEKIPARKRQSVAVLAKIANEIKHML